ncbi:hypothetical protein F8M41_023395 [Gigaspora margarita]|uniref:Uncharacterized protein n=1 Tax=Gigaspora margarita TaxID=4874 RepID=A0A8H4ADE2_GIGMA|nr:hypothetical protein F8M41_023395 [Gigaspora margarita]
MGHESDFTIRYEGNLQLIDKLRIAKEIALRLLDDGSRYWNEMGNAGEMINVAEYYRNGVVIARYLNKAKYWFDREKDLTSAANKCDWQHNLEIEDTIDRKYISVIVDSL